jgi:hypothetical protein
VASVSIPISIRDMICSDSSFCEFVSVGSGVFGFVLRDMIQFPCADWVVSPGKLGDGML